MVNKNFRVLEKLTKPLDILYFSITSVWDNIPRFLTYGNRLYFLKSSFFKVTQISNFRVL